MPFFHMVMADQDEEYVKRLTQWFRENKPHQFQISAFTQVDSFQQFLQSSEMDMDVFLVGEKFLNPEICQKANLIALGQAVSTPSLPYVERYQTAPALCSQVLSLISQWHHELPKWTGSRKSELVVCYSTDLRLKSTLALWLAMVSPDFIHMNFEAFPFYMLQCGNHNNRSISDILYHIKSSKGNLPIALESAINSDPSGIRFIPPVDNPRDLLEITNKENGILLESLASWGQFSRIIADIECSTSEKTMQWFEAATYIVIPFTTCRLHQIIRLKNMLQQLPNMNQEKIKWVLAQDCHTEDISKLFPDLHYLPWLQAFPANWQGCNMTEPVFEQLNRLLTSNGKSSNQSHSSAFLCT